MAPKIILRHLFYGTNLNTKFQVPTFSTSKVSEGRRAPLPSVLQVSESPGLLGLEGRGHPRCFQYRIFDIFAYYEKTLKQIFDINLVVIGPRGHKPPENAKKAWKSRDHAKKNKFQFFLIPKNPVFCIMNYLYTKFQVFRAKNGDFRLKKLFLRAVKIFDISDQDFWKNIFKSLRLRFFGVGDYFFHQNNKKTRADWYRGWFLIVVFF